MRRKKAYVLYGCPIDLNRRYDEAGYVGVEDGKICLISDKNKAIVYHTKKKDGHGSIADWTKLFKEDYGFNVHPIFLKK